MILFKMPPLRCRPRFTKRVWIVAREGGTVNKASLSSLELNGILRRIEIEENSAEVLGVC